MDLLLNVLKKFSPRKIADEVILAAKEITYLNQVIISITRTPVRMRVSQILAGRKGVTVSEWKRNPNSGNYINVIVISKQKK